MFKLISRLLSPLVIHAETHVGRVRKNNEDACLAVRTGRAHALLLVADGVGGHRAGEVASALVAKRFQSLTEEKLFLNHKCLPLVFFFQK